MTHLRVLHVYKYFRPQFTGEGVFLERLAPLFARLRPDVSHEVLVSATPRPAKSPALPGIAALHYLSGATMASQRDIVGWLARNGGRYAVVHHHTHVDRTFVGNLQLKLRGCRIVQSATLDDSLDGLLRSYRPIFRPMIRQLFQLIDQFIAISPKLFEQNNRFAPLEKSALVPIGIPLVEPSGAVRRHCRDQLRIVGDAPVLVCVGGVCARKDQKFLVGQLPRLLMAWPKLVLVFVGPVLESDYASDLEQFVAEQGLEAHVRFVGHSEDPMPFYQAADIMVSASQAEGFGTVMIEAMASGVPIVARHLPGVNDTFIEHARSGYLFSQSADFHAQVCVLLQDTKHRSAIGAAGRKFVAANYRIDDIAARYLELYRLGAKFAPRS